VSRQQHGEGHHAGPGQHGKDPQRRQRAAEEEGYLRVDRDQRGAIHVTPIQVSGAIEEVELVTEVAVAEEAGNVEQDFRGDGRYEHGLREGGKWRNSTA